VTAFWRRSTVSDNSRAEGKTGRGSTPPLAGQGLGQEIREAFGQDAGQASGRTWGRVSGKNRGKKDCRKSCRLKRRGRQAASDTLYSGRQRRPRKAFGAFLAVKTSVGRENALAEIPWVRQAKKQVISGLFCGSEGEG